MIGMRRREAQAGTMKPKVRQTTARFLDGTNNPALEEMESIIRGTDPSVLPANIVDFRRSAATEESLTGVGSVEARSPDGEGVPEASDLDRALFDEMSANLPEFLPVERIEVGIAQMALGLLLFGGLLAFAHSRF
jgi:hypothetical protein